jgi:hypothetical protein
MQRFFTTLQNTEGQALYQAKVVVKTNKWNYTNDSEELVEADIYDRDGNPIPQPIFTDYDGLVDFYAPNGKYDLVVGPMDPLDPFSTRTFEVLLEDYQTNVPEGTLVSSHTNGLDYPLGTTMMSNLIIDTDWPEDAVLVATHKNDSHHALQLVGTPNGLATRVWTGPYSIAPYDFTGVDDSPLNSEYWKHTNTSTRQILVRSNKGHIYTDESLDLGFTSAETLSQFEFIGDFEQEIDFLNHSQTPLETLDNIGQPIKTYNNTFIFGVKAGDQVLDIRFVSDSNIKSLPQNPFGKAYRVVLDDNQIAEIFLTDDLKDGRFKIKRVNGLVSLFYYNSTKVSFIHLCTTDKFNNYPATVWIHGKSSVGSFSIDIDDFKFRSVDKVVFTQGINETFNYYEDGFNKLNTKYWSSVSDGAITSDGFIASPKVINNIPNLVISNDLVGTKSGEITCGTKFKLCGDFVLQVNVSDSSVVNDEYDAGYGVRLSDNKDNYYTLKALVTGKPALRQIELSRPNAESISVPRVANNCSFVIKRINGNITFQVNDGSEFSEIISNASTEDLKIELLAFNRRNKLTSVTISSLNVVGDIVYDSLQTSGTGWSDFQKYPVLNEHGRIPAEYLADYWAANSVDNGNGGSTEEFSYMTLLNSSSFGMCYFDCFNTEDHEVTAEGDPIPSFFSMGSYWQGKKGSVLITQDVTQDNELQDIDKVFRAFYLHAECDASSQIETEYSFDTVTWYRCDTSVCSEGSITSGIVNRAEGFDKLYFKFTWNGSGRFYSYGVLYKSQNNSYVSDLKFREYFEVRQGYPAGSTLVLPKGINYTVNNKSLEVYYTRNDKTGYKWIPSINGGTGDYIELNPTTIRLLNPINPGDILEFEEKYGYVDKSFDNMMRLYNEHDTVGRHVFQDTRNPNARYRFIVADGILSLVPYTPDDVQPTGLQSAIDREHSLYGHHILPDSVNPSKAWKLVVTDGVPAVIPYQYNANYDVDLQDEIIIRTDEDNKLQQKIDSIEKTIVVGLGSLDGEYF